MGNEICFNVCLTVEVTDEDIEDIMSIAFEDGIAYWCDKCEICDESKGKNVIEHLINGGKIRFHASEEKIWFIMDKNDLIKGIRMCLEDDCAESLTAIDGELPFMHIDTGNVDSIMADAMIQYALFNMPEFG